MGCVRTRKAVAGMDRQERDAEKPRCRVRGVLPKKIYSGRGPLETLLDRAKWSPFARLPLTFKIQDFTIRAQVLRVSRLLEHSVYGSDQDTCKN